MTATDEKSERTWIAGHNRSAKAAAITAFGKPSPHAEGTIDLVVLAPRDAAEAVYFAQKVAGRVTAATRLIVAIDTDQTRTGHPKQEPDLEVEIERQLAPLGWKSSDQAPLGQTHTALGFERA